MHPLTRAAFVITATLVLGGCVQGNRAAARPGSQTDLITRDDIERGSQVNVYDLVQALRSNWLRTRGPDTLIGSPSEVLVYVDGMRYGGVEILRGMSTTIVEEVRHYSGIDASARWGLDHGAGVIEVTTRR